MPQNFGICCRFVSGKCRLLFGKSLMGTVGRYPKEILLLNGVFLSYDSRNTSRKPNYYETLGVASDASRQEIRKAFTELSAKERRALQQLSEAFQTLNNPDTRLQYDRKLGSSTEGAKESSETENVKSGGGDSNASEDPENTWAKVEAMRSRMSEEGLRVDREMSDKSFWQKAKHMNEFRLREMEKLNRDVKNSKSATGTAGGHQKNPAGEKCQKFGPNSGVLDDKGRMTVEFWRRLRILFFLLNFTFFCALMLLYMEHQQRVAAETELEVYRKNYPIITTEEQSFEET